MLSCQIMPTYTKFWKRDQNILISHPEEQDKSVIISQKEAKSVSSILFFFNFFQVKTA